MNLADEITLTKQQICCHKTHMLGIYWDFVGHSGIIVVDITTLMLLL